MLLDQGRGLMTLWKSLGSDPKRIHGVRISHSGHYLPSVYDVSGMATSTIAAAHLAVGELLALRRGDARLPEIEIDGLEASAAFRTEALMRPVSWEIPPPWDPIAGDYCAQDGWIRIHTNYENHRDAALSALGLSSADRAQVTQAVSRWNAAELEKTIMAQGGCAARMLTEDEWSKDQEGSTTLSEPIVALSLRHTTRAIAPPWKQNEAPLSGVRVLDLTRVIAGPECTRFLAAWGANVLRIDPPGFQEVPALLPDVTAGKHCASLSLHEQQDLQKFEELVRLAHVLVIGYRPDALDRFNLTPDHLYSLNPNLVLAQLNAYGWSGPLKNQRGFDSLMQMKTGIAARGMKELATSKPHPLPAQALDHGAGYALAAGICRALHGLWTCGENQLVRASLVGASNFLRSEYRAGDPNGTMADFSSTLIPTQTEWGTLHRVRNPGRIQGLQGAWNVPAGRLGRHPASF
ncbi:MAG: CoA transferase [Bdellovibrionia bacterium]